MVQYTLVNPSINGEISVNTNSKNSVEAANFFYNEMSQYFNNHVPNFMFSFQKGGSNGKLYHYRVTETRNDNQVDFKLKEQSINDEERLNQFRTRLQNHQNKQAGGNKHRKSKKSKKDDSSDDMSDSSDSSDVSSDDYLMGTSNNYSRSIYYWWYDPYVYNMESLFLPTFYSYVTPYVELAVLPTFRPLV